MRRIIGLKVSIESGNSALVEGQREEIVANLRDVVQRIESCMDHGKIFDSNGNSVGTFNLLWEDEEADEADYQANRERCFDPD